MSNEVTYFLGFCVIVASFLFLFPYQIGLNAATNLRKPFYKIDVKSYLLRKDRFLVAMLSIGVFAFSLFAFKQAEVAIILGSIIMATFVVLDYKRIYQGNRDGSDEIET